MITATRATRGRRLLQKLLESFGMSEGRGYSSIVIGFIMGVVDF